MSDILKQLASSQGPINETLLVDIGKSYQIVSVSMKVDVAPTTSEDLTITMLSTGGDQYDIPLYTLDLSVLGVTSMIWQPDQPMFLVGGDGLKVDWLNTDDRLWGLEYTLRRIHP
jgi:hypothetical protein